MAASSMEQVRPARLHHRAQKHDPDERDRDEYLPAQAHDLVVAIAGERRANPQKDEQNAADLAEEPEKAPDALARQGRPWREPAAEKHDRRQRRDKDHG